MIDRDDQPVEQQKSPLSVLATKSSRETDGDQLNERSLDESER